MNSESILILIIILPCIISFIIYRIIYFKTHEYSCPYCRYRIPMNMFSAPSSSIVSSDKPRIKCPSCKETSFFNIVEKEKKVSTKS